MEVSDIELEADVVRATREATGGYSELTNVGAATAFRSSCFEAGGIVWEPAARMFF